MGVLLQVDEVRKSHGTHVLFDGASVSMSEGQKIGFIGRNGAGKSTLLRMIIGAESLDSGRIIHHPGLTLGYLEQQEVFAAGETVMAYLQRKSDKPDWACAKLAAKFQLKSDRLQMVVTELSGGYQMRVKLAAMLLRDPNLLLLDEPTNYLDLQTILLLEAFLRDFRGAFVIVSHDREFLKNTCDHTLEVERGQLSFYPRDVEEYLAFKEAQVEMKKRFNKNVQVQQEHLLEFINRFRAKASKATQAQSKLKQLAKLKAIQIDQPLKTVRIHIPQVDQKKSFALRTCHLSIGYGERHVADAIEIEIQRGEHVAILGENGQGKSTLLKTLADEIPPVAGSFVWGNRLRIAYYAQHVHMALHPNQTVGGHLETTASAEVQREDVLRMAGNFLFTLDDLEKPVSILSGGEKARLCLAGILLGRPDVLLLDEPTNHLDLETVEALGASLAAYRGTIFFISHSRTFVNLLATHILNVNDGSVKRYPGTYEEYVYSLQQTLGTNEEHREAQPQTHQDGTPVRTKAIIYAELKEQKQALKKLERDLAHYEAERELLMQAFLQSPTDYSRERNEKVSTVTTVIAHVEDQWLKVQQDVERLNEEISVCTQGKE